MLVSLLFLNIRDKVRVSLVFDSVHVSHTGPLKMIF